MGHWPRRLPRPPDCRAAKATFVGIMVAHVAVKSCILISSSLFSFLFFVVASGRRLHHLRRRGTVWESIASRADTTTAAAPREPLRTVYVIVNRHSIHTRGKKLTRMETPGRFAETKIQGVARYDFFAVEHRRRPKPPRARSEW